MPNLLKRSRVREPSSAVKKSVQGICRNVSANTRETDVGKGGKALGILKGLEGQNGTKSNRR